MPGANLTSLLYLDLDCGLKKSTVCMVSGRSFPVRSCAMPLVGDDVVLGLSRFNHSPAEGCAWQSLSMGLEDRLVTVGLVCGRFPPRSSTRTPNRRRSARSNGTPSAARSCSSRLRANRCRTFSISAGPLNTCIQDFLASWFNSGTVSSMQGSVSIQHGRIASMSLSNRTRSRTMHHGGVNDTHLQ